MRVAMITETIAERFWAKVEKREDHYWWTGATNKKGYGIIGLGTREAGTALAHRVAWFLEHGEWPTKQLRHTCDTPPCVWAAQHLLDGTPLQNTQDMMRRGRNSPPPIRRGEEANMAKLKEFQVLEIKGLLVATSLTHREIAGRYGVSRSLIGRIDSGQAWGWLTAPEGM